MFAMFRMFFASMTMVFSAVNKGATALDNLATIGEEMSKEYVDIARIERAAKLKAATKDAAKASA